MVSAHDEQLAAKKQRTERVTKRILTEEEMSALSDKLMKVTKGMTITVRYFKEDTAHPEVPAVGNYITLTGRVDRIDPVFRTLQVGDTVVPFEDLVEVSGEGIMEIDQYLGITEDRAQKDHQSKKRLVVLLTYLKRYMWTVSQCSRYSETSYFLYGEKDYNFLRSTV